MEDENESPREEEEEAEEIEEPETDDSKIEEKVNLQQMEQLEAAKLKSKYPQALRPGGSSFLQRRLNKQKYFDSGDYNMAKAKGQKAQLPVLQQPTGEAIPTPDNLPTRKTSLVQRNGQ